VLSRIEKLQNEDNIGYSQRFFGSSGKWSNICYDLTWFERNTIL